MADSNLFVTGKRKRTMSRAMKRSKGLASDSDSDSGSDEYRSDDEVQGVPTSQLSSPPAPTSFSLAPEPLSRTLSSTSLAQSDAASQAPATSSTATSQAPAASVTATVFKDAKTRAEFAKRFATATTSDADVLDRQMKAWKSDVYNHFRMPPTILRTADGIVQYKYICKSHPSMSVVRVRHDDSTSNLKRHVMSCTPADSKESQAMTSYSQGSQYTPEKHRLKIALWVASASRPFSIVEDPGLLDIFHDLNARCKTPTRQTVSRDIKEIFVVSREKVGEILRAYPGKVHIAADGWTSPHVIAFVGTTVHWIVDGRVASAILDFIKVTKAHTGEHLAARIAECLRAYGIHDKILGFVADNASNNNTLVNELGRILPGFNGKKSRVRCFAHILNLVVKAILSQFSRKSASSTVGEDSEGMGSEVDNQLDMLEREMVFGDGVGDEDPAVGEDEDNIADDVLASDSDAIDAVIEDDEHGNVRLQPLLALDADLGKLSIAKLRTLANKIVNSPTIKEDLEQCCRTTGIEPKLMIRDVSTRWNSTAELIQRALELEDALKILVIMEAHNRPRGVRLRRFRLSEAEWKLLKEVSPLLDIFLYVTQRISSNRIPLIHDVIPLIDIITNELVTDFVDNLATHPVVRHAAYRGYLMLNKYYSLTDDSSVYRIAMILHPKYKTKYFVDAGWDRSWIQEAEDLVRTEWKANYKNYSPSQADSQRAVPQQDPGTNSRLAAAKKRFDTLKDKSAPVDAMEDWLSTAVINTSSDAMVYWTGMLSAGHELAPMALDFLSIPATSTDVERSFSRGGLTVSKLRHSLTDKSTRAATVVGSWTSFNGAIPTEKLLSIFKDKSSRKRKKAKTAHDNAGDAEASHAADFIELD